MKNKFKSLFLTLLLVLVLPLVTFLTACGATPSNEITGILFDALKYTEDGVPVFEVDKNITTELKYKIYPSSASGYKVYFDPAGTGTTSNSSRFVFEDGKITVNSDSFEEVKYRVRVGEFSDTCIIRLKEYPTKIYAKQTNVTMHTGDVKDIKIFAEINGETKQISENDYNFLVETNDETIINIPNKNCLKFIARQDIAEQVKVTVTLLDSQGEVYSGLDKIEINVNVIKNIEDSLVAVSGSSKLAKSGDEIDIDYQKLDSEGEYKVIKLSVFPFNTGDILVRNEADNYLISLSSKNYAKLSEDGKDILLSGDIPNNYSFSITIYTQHKMQDNTTFCIDLKFNIKNVI